MEQLHALLVMQDITHQTPAPAPASYALLALIHLPQHQSAHNVKQATTVQALVPRQVLSVRSAAMACTLQQVHLYANNATKGSTQQSLASQPAPHHAHKEHSPAPWAPVSAHNVLQGPTQTTLGSLPAATAAMLTYMQDTILVRFRTHARSLAQTHTSQMGFTVSYPLWYYPPPFLLQRQRK